MIHSLLQITELEGHTSLVTSIVVVPVETAAVRVAFFCWTASLDGTIRYWDFSTSELVKTIEINHPIYSMVRFDSFHFKSYFFHFPFFLYIIIIRR